MLCRHRRRDSCPGSRWDLFCNGVMILVFTTTNGEETYTMTKESSFIGYQRAY